jgi:hypothetical protein
VLKLKDVTLVAIDTRWPDLALKSLQRSMKRVDFGSVKLIHSKAYHPDDRDIESCVVPPLASAEEYSRFMLKNLIDYIETDHVLVTQWDSWVVDTSKWTDEFLSYDYVGAPWPNCAPALSVGNGGFSLRSKALLKFTAMADISKTHPEDVAIIDHHNHLGSSSPISVAPLYLAKDFSFERPLDDEPRNSFRKSFGFHGLFNFPYFLTENELFEILRLLPPSIRESVEFWDLVEDHDLDKSRLPWQPVKRLTGLRRLVSKLRVFKI